MALLDIGNAYQVDDTTDLFKRFLGSCLKSAAYILSEDPGTANHVNRLVWARAMLANDTAAVYARVRQIIRWGAATNVTMQAGPNALTDNDIDFIVASGLDQFATGN